MRRARKLGVIATGAVLGLVAATTLASPAAAKPSTLLDGLSSPKGLAIAPNGHLIVGQGAFGPPGPVLDLVSRKPPTAVPLTDPFNVMDVAVASDGTGWAIGGDLILYRQDPGGTPTPVLDIQAYRNAHPDPTDTEGDPTESNPFSLTLIGDEPIVVDAAGNDIIRVPAVGDPFTMARFDLEEISTDHFPPEAGLPPTIPAEAVPTTAVVGPDGFIYVGELKGFPFRPGSSRIWRIDPAAVGATCSAVTPDPACTSYDTGFTAIQDIAFDPNTGALYVYELAEGGVLAFEAGFETGTFPPAVLLQVVGASRTELERGHLSQPGGIVVDSFGTIFVTDRLFTEFGGRLLRVRSAPIGSPA